MNEWQMCLAVLAILSPIVVILAGIAVILVKRRPLKWMLLIVVIMLPLSYALARFVIRIPVVQAALLGEQHSGYE